MSYSHCEICFPSLESHRAFFKARCRRIEPSLSWVTAWWDGTVRARNRLSIFASGESLSSRVLSRPTHSHLEMSWELAIVSIRLTMMSASWMLLESEYLTIHESLESQRRPIFSCPNFKSHNRMNGCHLEAIAVNIEDVLI
jgi:hypothetical protein